MRFFLLATFVIFSVGCSERNASDQPIPMTGVNGDPNSDEPRFEFLAPEGFKWNHEQKAWRNENRNINIVLAHDLGVTFKTVVDTFVADRLRAENMELLSKEIRDIDGRPTLLMHGKRRSSMSFQHIITVAYGTDTGSAQLIAISLSEIPENWKTQIEDSLLKSRYVEP